MHEKPEIEQFFFDEPTLSQLAAFASTFDYPCCLCTPSLGQELEQRGVRVRTLDIDGRFSHLRGFQPYDLGSPRSLGERYGIIICDPPFLTVTLSQLLRVVEELSDGNYSQPLLINYLASRAPAITSTFAAFRLRPTGFNPGYARISNAGRNRMELYGNLSREQSTLLVPPTTSRI
jgi:hypothetical protein